MLEIRNLTKVYPDGTVALDNVSFTVADGEFLVVIGLSGSGKSTLLRCVNRLVEPTSGTVIWNGADVTAASPRELRPLRRRIGMVFQQFNLVKRSSVMRNVLAGRLGYVGALRGVLGLWSPADRARAEAALATVGIAHKATSRADALSGGQQQRVGIARALMQEPRLLLADEPVASLDPATSHSVLDHLRDLNVGQGVTVICSLHFLSLAREYATRVLALKDGRIVFEGDPDEVDAARFRAIYGEDASEIEIA